MARRKHPRPDPTPPPPPSEGAELWLQLPNAQDSVLNPQARGMFDPHLGGPTWPTVKAHTKTIILRRTAFQGDGMFSDHKDAGKGSGTKCLAETFLPFCDAAGFDLAINATGAGRAQCPGREDLVYGDIEVGEKLVGLGWRRPLAWRMQSLYSGTVPDCKDLYPKAGGLDLREADVRRFVWLVEARFPGSAYVVADTGPAKQDAQHNADWDYAAFYDRIGAVFTDLGLAAPAWHAAWAVEEMAADASDVNAFDAYMRSRGWRYGITLASDQDTSDAGYFAGIMQGATLLGSQGIRPHVLVCTAWGTEYPLFLYPEGQAFTFTNTALGLIEAGMVAPRAAP